MKYVIRLLYFLLILIFLLPFITILAEILSRDKSLNFFNMSEILRATFTTVEVAIYTLILNILIGLPAAAVLHKNEGIFSKFLNIFLFLPLIVPGIVITFGSYYNFLLLGISDSILGVVILHTVVTIPYFLKAVISGYRALNRDYFFLGKVFGASPLESYREIILPKLLPAIVTGGTLVLVLSFSQYLTTLIIGGGRVKTLPIIIYPYVSTGEFKITSILSTLFIFANIGLIYIIESIVKRVYKEG